ncbi:MAG: MFS transporter, partial [Solirubrobacteraceae bacterium]
DPAGEPATTKGVEMTRERAKNRSLRWVVGLTSTAYFMVVLDAVVVITALPRMQRDLHVGLSSLQWTVNAYGIAFAAGIITAAALGDRFGRRLVFNSGLALFTVASVHGHVGSPAAVTAGVRPALWACVCFAALAALSGIAIASPRRAASTRPEPADRPIPT